MSFFFPCFFSLLTNDFYFDLGPHYVLKAHKELRWAATTITGPNDASGVVWALGRRSWVFFFPLHNRLCLLTYVIIKFLGFNDVVDIAVIFYVDTTTLSEFLTTIHQHPDTRYKKPVG